MVEYPFLVVPDPFMIIMIIIIIASHDNEMNEIYNDKIYMRRSDTMK